MAVHEEVIDLRRLIDEIGPVLLEADECALLSLDPRTRTARSPVSAPGWFHRYRVMGQTMLDHGAETRGLLEDLLNDIHPWPGWRCLFTPRHGLHARRGDQVVELVMCYSCGEVVVARPEGFASERIGLRRTTQEPFTTLLTAAGIPIAP